MTFQPSINPPDPPTSAQLTYLDSLLAQLEHFVESGRLAPHYYTNSEARFLSTSTKAEAGDLINDLRSLLGRD